MKGLFTFGLLWAASEEQIHGLGIIAGIVWGEENVVV